MSLPVHCDVGMSGERVFCVGSSFGGVATIGAQVDDLDATAGERFVKALKAFDGVLHIFDADEDHDLAAVGKGFFYEFATLATSLDVVCAQIADTIAIGSIAIDADDVGVVGPLVDHAHLIIGACRTDGDSFGSTNEEVVDDLLLFRCRTIASAKDHFDVAEFAFGFFGSCFSVSPEVSGDVGYEAELGLFYAR